MNISTADYGAGPKRNADQNREALLQAIKVAEESGGGTVVLAPGEYRGPTPASRVIVRFGEGVEFIPAGQQSTVYEGDDTHARFHLRSDASTDDDPTTQHYGVWDTQTGTWASLPTGPATDLDLETAETIRALFERGVTT